MSAKTNSDMSVNCLMASLKEAQDTVRSYDTKAQIVGVGFIFTLGILTDFGGRLTEEMPDANLWIVLGFWLLFIGPAIMFGAVLYPSRKALGQIDSGELDLKFISYLPPQDHRSLEEIRECASSCDWLSELSFELMKVSRLREIKRKRFIRALLSVLGSYVIIAVFQMIRSEGFFLVQ